MLLGTVNEEFLCDIKLAIRFSLYTGNYCVALFLLCFVVKVDFLLESVAMLHLFSGSLKFFFEISKLPILWCKISI